MLVKLYLFCYCNITSKTDVMVVIVARVVRVVMNKFEKIKNILIMYKCAMNLYRKFIKKKSIHKKSNYIRKSINKKYGSQIWIKNGCGNCNLYNNIDTCINDDDCLWKMKKKLCIFRKHYKSARYSKLVDRYKLDIENGNDESRVKLAWLLLHGREGVPAENRTAFELINSIHIEDSPDIIGIRAFLFLIGIECVRNERKAFKLAKYSAEQGSAYGYLVVGMLYHWGGAGLEQDDKLAIDNFMKAAHLNLDMGYYMLGALYAINENYEKSFYFYMLAANQGHPDACYDVGRCYEYGIGVSLNIENAVLWYNRAVASGRVDALSHLEDLS